MRRHAPRLHGVDNAAQRGLTIDQNSSLTSLDGLDALRPIAQHHPLYDATPGGEEVDALLARLTAFSGSVINSKNTGTCPSS